MVSESELPKVSSRKKEPKMLTGSELRQARMFHSHPSWARSRRYSKEGPNPILSHMRNTVSPYCSRKGRRTAKCVRWQCG